MSRKRPQVSVLMPVFDAAATLAASVQSIQAQTDPDWELLLIDDCSRDGSPDLARRLAQGDPRIRLLQMPRNSGAAAARNHGLAAARGRFIAFLDADDLWRPDKLAHQLAFHRRTGAALSFTGYARVCGAGGALIRTVPARDGLPYHRLLRHNPIGCLTAIYDTSICGKVEMPEFRRQHDYALWLRLVRRHGPARGLNEDLAIYRVRRQSLSSDKRAAAADIWRVLRRQERLPLPRAAWFFSHYAWHGLRYRLVQRPRRDAPVVLAPDRGRTTP